MQRDLPRLRADRPHRNQLDDTARARGIPKVPCLLNGGTQIALAGLDSSKHQHGQLWSHDARK